MKIASPDVEISIKPDYYCFLPEDHQHTTTNRRVEILKLYWNFTDPDGWGSLSEDYVFVDDIALMTRKLKEFEHGVSAQLDAELYGCCKDRPFIILHLERVGMLYAVNLKVYNSWFSEYNSVYNELSEDEWKSCSDELMNWEQEYSLHLGDRVETLIDCDDRIFYKGRIGEVSQIYPESENSPPCADVMVTETGWGKKPYQTSRLYRFDELRQVSDSSCTRP